MAQRARGGAGAVADGRGKQGRQRRGGSREGGGRGRGRGRREGGRLRWDVIAGAGAAERHHPRRAE